MIKDNLSYEEQSSLEAICRFHGCDDKDLVKHLATFCNWIRADEQAKFNFGPAKPPYLIALLSTMGIYGADVLSPPPSGATS